MTIKLIVIDLDETLLKTDKTYDRERFNKVVETLHEGGLTVCIATGNSYHKIRDYFDKEMLDDLYFACDNGNYIVFNDELLKTTSVADETLYKIVDFLDEFDGFHILVGGGKTAYFRQGTGHAYDFVSRYNNEIKIVEKFQDMEEDHHASKIAIYSEHSLSKNKTMVRILRERFEDIDSVTSGDQWLDIYSIDGGKGSAVKYLQEKYNISRDETIVFGDSMNDESMMNEAKYSVAMGNADRELYLAANYRIGTNADQAVISLLEELIQSDTPDFMDKYLIHKA